MDFNSLKDQVSNLSLYDLKAGVRKVQNGELEATLIVWDMRAHEAYSCHELHRDGIESQGGDQQRALVSVKKLQAYLGRVADGLT